MDFQTAVLEGIKLAPFQVFGCFVDSSSEEGACVMGTALLGLLQNMYKVSQMRPWAVYFELLAAFPVLESRRSCPECGVSDLAAYVGVHLNDSHRWSRERIAQWIENDA